jgi:hypothetical protein
MTTTGTPPKFLKLGIGAAIVGAAMLVAFVVVQVTEFPLDGASLLLILGLALLIGGIKGGVWASKIVQR